MRINFRIDILHGDLLAFGKKISIVDKIISHIPDTDDDFGRKWKKDLKTELYSLSVMRNDAAHGFISIENGKFRLRNRGKDSELGKNEIAKHFYDAYDAQIKLENLLSNKDKVTKYVLDR
jgi:hypothetical protein